MWRLPDDLLTMLPLHPGGASPSPRKLLLRIALDASFYLGKLGWGLIVDLQAPIRAGEGDALACS